MARPAEQLAGDDSPLATALSEGAGLAWGADIVSFGALVAITSVVLTILYGQTRVAYSMCRDGLMPERLGTIWEKTKTPVALTLFCDPDRGPRRLRAAQEDRRAGEHRNALRMSSSSTSR